MNHVRHRFVRGHLYHFVVKGGNRESLLQFQYKQTGADELGNMRREYIFSQLACLDSGGTHNICIAARYMDNFIIAEVTQEELPKFLYMNTILPLYEKLIKGVPHDEAFRSRASLSHDRKES
jgi:hypothetical protein